MTAQHCAQPELDPLGVTEHAPDIHTSLDGAACLRKLGNLATGSRPNTRLRLLEQQDKAFMWKASSVHPLQVLENAYQRVVHRAGREAETDPISAQSETLSRFFTQDAGHPECHAYQPLEAYDGQHLAAVRMNHLIDSFYLFRLLVQYQVESDAEISEDLRMGLSGDLTKLLHNGDRARMRWLSDWLTAKVAELGRMIEALNEPDKKRVIFFLKGGRALNFFLGTPEKGENDWDTQVVIDPHLPAEDWYRCFAEVHDVLLVALKTFKAEFTELVRANAAQLAEYLADKFGPESGEDEEIDENEAGDVSSLGEHASCKAELIDIGIPRRDSARALEEWVRLSAPNALMVSNGIVFPHRAYYLDEYLMMLRDTFLPNAEVLKAPKRISRFGLILESGGEGGECAKEERLLMALPETTRKVATLDSRRRRELFRLTLAQFVESYNLVQDKELAEHFDRECLALISHPPQLPDVLARVLDKTQEALATDIGVAHALSTRMDHHWEARSSFFEDQHAFFATFVSELSRLTRESLQTGGAQFAVAGSYAARLHAGHLRVKTHGLEPIRRILIKLHCAHGDDRARVMAAVSATIVHAARQTQKLSVVKVNEESLLLFWAERVTMGSLTYAPLVMKIRVAEQKGSQLPVLASIDGLPVLDLRYLAADYLKKTSKVDERGSRRVLASATAAISAMLSRFDFESDETE
jgi:hypothetical protein